MRFTTWLAVGCLTLLPGAASAMDQHVGVTADQLKWGPAPAALPKGAEIAVVQGDPGKDGPYVVRVRVPASYKVPAHTHPQDENVTVLSGSFNVGMGGKLDETKGQKLGPGGYFHAAKGMQHYAWFTEPSVIQIHGVGPFAIEYVNPADDPRKTH